MIAIPPGQVTLSDRRTQRRWSVALAPYQLAAFAVTQAQYAQVTGRRPSTAQGDRLPVEGVSWLDAVRFCNALSEREGVAPAYRRMPTSTALTKRCAAVIGTVVVVRSAGGSDRRGVGLGRVVE
jgi:formylglycine-generating enzyme required for sulfatase activity